MKKVTEFERKVYDLMRKIPKGKVSTYGFIAEKLGTKAYRAVGQACKKNPFAPVVPCHRVVSSDGGIGGFSSGIKKKIKILEKEGIKVKNKRIVDFEKKLFRF